MTEFAELSLLLSCSSWLINIGIWLVYLGSAATFLHTWLLLFFFTSTRWAIFTPFIRLDSITPKTLVISQVLSKINKQRIKRELNQEINENRSKTQRFKQFSTWYVLVPTCTEKHCLVLSLYQELKLQGYRDYFKITRMELSLSPLDCYINQLI